MTKAQMGWIAGVVLLAGQAAPALAAPPSGPGSFSMDRCGSSVGGDRNARLTILPLGDPQNEWVEWRPPGSASKPETVVQYRLNPNGKLSEPSSIQIRGAVELTDPIKSVSATLLIVTPNGQGWRLPENIIQTKNDPSRTGLIIMNSAIYSHWQGVTPVFNAISAGEILKIRLMGDTGEVFSAYDLDFSDMGQRDRLLAEARRTKPLDCHQPPPRMLAPPPLAQPHG